MVNKYAIFVVGEGRTGKSSLIRSLTGCGRNMVYNLKKIDGTVLKAFVSLNSPQEMGMDNYPPETFPKTIEDKHNVKREDYDVLISALRLTVRNPSVYGYQMYIESVVKQGFDVRLAVIAKSWNGIKTDSKDISAIKLFAKSKKIKII